MGEQHPFFKRLWYVTWHKFSARRFSVKFGLFHSFILVAWVFAFIYPAVVSRKLDYKYAVGAIIAYIIYGILKNYPFVRNFQRTYFTKHKMKRKFMTADILDKMIEHSLNGRPRTPEEGIPLLEEILQVITDHIRTFRYDREEEKIFCSIMLEYDVNKLKVIARNEHGARGYPTYKKADMQAWTTMTHKKVIGSGNIYIDFPATPANKPYKSVLTIPIFYDNDCIAVLSIDSSEPYHFTGVEETINTRVLSYAVLLKKVLLEYGIYQYKKGGVK